MTQLSLATLVVFTVECVVRCYYHGVVRKSLLTFLVDPFNLLDMSIITMDFIILALATVVRSDGNFGKILRLFRLVRLLRLIRAGKLLGHVWSTPVRYELQANNGNSSCTTDNRRSQFDFTSPSLLLLGKMVETVANLLKYFMKL